MNDEIDLIPIEERYGYEVWNQALDPKEYQFNEVEFKGHDGWHRYVPVEGQQPNLQLKYVNPLPWPIHRRKIPVEPGFIHIGLDDNTLEFDEFLGKHGWEKLSGFGSGLTPRKLLKDVNFYVVRRRITKLRESGKPDARGWFEFANVEPKSGHPVWVYGDGDSGVSYFSDALKIEGNFRFWMPADVPELPVARLSPAQIAMGYYLKKYKGHDDGLVSPMIQEAFLAGYHAAESKDKK